jgi:hypothetical protein
MSKIQLFPFKEVNMYCFGEIIENGISGSKHKVNSCYPLDVDKPQKAGISRLSGKPNEDIVKLPNSFDKFYFLGSTYTSNSGNTTYDGYIMDSDNNKYFTEIDQSTLNNVLMHSYSCNGSLYGPFKFINVRSKGATLVHLESRECKEYDRLNSVKELDVVKSKDLKSGDVLLESIQYKSSSVNCLYIYIGKDILTKQHIFLQSDVDYLKRKDIFKEISEGTFNRSVSWYTTNRCSYFEGDTKSLYRRFIKVDTVDIKSNLKSFSSLPDTRSWSNYFFSISKEDIFDASNNLLPNISI